jgi:long-chain acyl-CoA synthetase
LCYTSAVNYQSLAEMFLSQAKRYGERVLYRFARDGRWESSTWKDALSQVREIALGLVSLGIKKGDRVAIFSANRVDWSLIDWANICIKALTVPVYASSTSAQLSHIVGHSGATVLFIESAERLKRLETSLLALQALRNVIVIDDGGRFESPSSPVSRLSLRELKMLGRRYAETRRDVFERTALSLRPDDDLTIIYTSGTTGEPKGVLTTHRHYLFMLQATCAAIPCSEEDVNLQFLPLAHSFGRLEHFLVVAKGFTCGFARSLETIGRDLLTVRPTILFSVPRIYENADERIRSRAQAAGLLRQRLFRWAVSVGARWSRHQSEGEKIPWSLRAAHGLAQRLVFSKIQRAFGGRLRLAISGGAALAPEIARFFHSIGILILEGYGLTECATVSHVNRLERYKFGTVGLPLPGVECSVDKDGEVLLRGANIFKGYYRDQAGTREVIDAEGWLHTGDIGEIDGDGFLRITDRKKDLIVTSGGKKVAPQAIENLLRTDPWIHQAMVIGNGQKHLLALVTLNRDQVAEWGRREGLEFRSMEEMATHPRVLAVVKERIRQKNKELAAFEAVRGFRVLPQDFTVENEALTPTLKLRRQFVMERYKDLIDEMARRPRFDV